MSGFSQLTTQNIARIHISRHKGWDRIYCYKTIKTLWKNSRELTNVYQIQALFVTIIKFLLSLSSSQSTKRTRSESLLSGRYCTHLFFILIIAWSSIRLFTFDCVRTEYGAPSNEYTFLKKIKEQKIFRMKP